MTQNYIKINSDNHFYFFQEATSVLLYFRKESNKLGGTLFTSLTPKATTPHPNHMY